MEPSLHVVPAPGFGRASAGLLLSRAERLARPVIGLPTGSTPLGLYEELAGLAHRGELDVSPWRPFAIDEYMGPRQHPCSNHSYFARHWDVIAGAPPVQQFDPEAPDPDAEAASFAARLSAAGGLDIAVLGIGLNGHVAFNEPGSSADSSARPVLLHEESRRSAAACWGTETPERGLTLGMAELLAARSVVLLANGESKARVVARAPRGAISPECPASLLRLHGDLAVVLDEQAASAL